MPASVPYHEYSHFLLIITKAGKLYFFHKYPRLFQHLYPQSLYCMSHNSGHLPVVLHRGLYIFFSEPIIFFQWANVYIRCTTDLCPTAGCCPVLLRGRSDRWGRRWHCGGWLLSGVEVTATTTAALITGPNYFSTNRPTPGLRQS